MHVKSAAAGAAQSAQSREPVEVMRGSCVAGQRIFSAEGVFGAFDPTALVIEEPKIVVHEAREPDFLADFRDAHRLPSECLAEVDLALADANPAAVGDDDGAVVEGVLHIANP
jgi:hypothetical protein